MSEIDLPRYLSRLRAALPAGTEIRVLDAAAELPLVEAAPRSAEADAAVAAFDWSAAAQKQWEDAQKPERTDLRAAAAQAVADNTAYLALASPTNAQTLAQVRRLTQQSSRVIRRLVQLD